MNETPKNASPWIVEATPETFEQDAVERSRERTVVLDFWAPWCAPCRTLGPLLEKAAEEGCGSFVLVKANADECQQAAAEFGVSALPTVIALRDGQPVDYFQGLLPEPQLKEWLQRIQPSEGEELIAAGEALRQTDPVAAEEKLRQAMDHADVAERAKIKLAELLLEESKYEESAALIAELEARGFLEPEAERVKSALQLRPTGAAEDLEVAKSRADENPDDPAALLQFGEALAAAGQYEEALGTLLEVVRKDSGDHREQARARMVDIFRVLPEDSPLVSEYRRKLSSALY